MKALVIAEHDNKTLAVATLSAITAACQLAKEITVLVIGYQCRAVAEEAALLSGVHQVLLADAAVYAHQLAENTASFIQTLAVEYQVIVAPATTTGKNLLPRVAALLDVAQISDITQVIDQETFIRPMYAGNVMATVRSHDAIKVVTIRPSAFAKAKPCSESATIEFVPTSIENKQARFVSEEVRASERPDLMAADIVIAGGRGLQSAENFSLLEETADRLHAAIGATRAAVDAGFVPNDFQIGQTGKVVAPKLYIAVGISGAIQHLAGMKNSKVIVAINKDPDAPIFKIADYGLVADLFTVLPQLNRELDKL